MKLNTRVKELSNLKFAILLMSPVVIFLLLIIIYPLFYSLVISFQRVTVLGGFQTLFIGTKNYIDLLRSSDVWYGTFISIRFTAESVIFTILIGLGISLALSKVEKGKGLIRSLVILPWAVSSYGAGVIFRYFWRGHSGLPTALAYLFGIEKRVSMLDQHTVEALAIGQAWRFAPLVAFFLLANLEVIPSGLYNMAKIDHLGAFKEFFYVTLPYLRYTLFVFTTIVVVFSLREFDFIFTQTGGGPGFASSVLPYQIYKSSFIDLNLGYGAAMSFYLLILIFLVALLLFFVWGRREA